MYVWFNFKYNYEPFLLQTEHNVHVNANEKSYVKHMLTIISYSVNRTSYSVSTFYVH